MPAISIGVVQRLIVVRDVSGNPNAVDFVNLGVSFLIWSGSKLYCIYGVVLNSLSDCVCKNVF